MSVSSGIVRELRRERGWSQEQLAAISGLSERTIQRIETDGACSLDSKMALASAFELSPSVLIAKTESPKVSTEMRTDWGGALGLFVCGLLAPIVVALTGTNGAWEIAAFTAVIGLTVTLSIMSYGARATYRFFDRTSWLVRCPISVSGLNEFISQARTVITTAYAVGVFTSAICAISITIYAPVMFEVPSNLVPIILKPVIYAALFSEFWIRPFKRKLQKMLASQIEASIQNQATDPARRLGRDPVS